MRYETRMNESDLRYVDSMLHATRQIMTNYGKTVTNERIYSVYPISVHR